MSNDERRQAPALDPEDLVVADQRLGRQILGGTTTYDDPRCFEGYSTFYVQHEIELPPSPELEALMVQAWRERADVTYRGHVCQVTRIERKVDYLAPDTGDGVLVVHLDEFNER